MIRNLILILIILNLANLIGCGGSISGINNFEIGIPITRQVDGKVDFPKNKSFDEIADIVNETYFKMHGTKIPRNWTIIEETLDKIKDKSGLNIDAYVQFPVNVMHLPSDYFYLKTTYLGLFMHELGHLHSENIRFHKNSFHKEALAEAYKLMSYEVMNKEFNYKSYTDYFGTGTSNYMIVPKSKNLAILRLQGLLNNLYNKDAHKRGFSLVYLVSIFKEKYTGKEIYDELMRMSDSEVLEFDQNSREKFQKLYL